MRKKFKTIAVSEETHEKLRDDITFVMEDGKHKYLETFDSLINELYEARNGHATLMIYLSECDEDPLPGLKKFYIENAEYMKEFALSFRKVIGEITERRLDRDTKTPDESPEE